MLADGGESADPDGAPGALAFRVNCAAEDADFVATTDAELEDATRRKLPCPPLNGSDARNVTLR